MLENLEMGSVFISLGLIRVLAVRTGRTIGDLGDCIHFEMMQGATHQVSMEVQLRAELRLPSDICASSSGISEAGYPRW